MKHWAQWAWMIRHADDETCSSSLRSRNTTKQILQESIFFFSSPEKTPLTTKKDQRNHAVYLVFRTNPFEGQLSAIFDRSLVNNFGHCRFRCLALLRFFRWFVMIAFGHGRFGCLALLLLLWWFMMITIGHCRLRCFAWFRFLGRRGCLINADRRCFAFCAQHGHDVFIDRQLKSSVNERISTSDRHSLKANLLRNDCIRLSSCLRCLSLLIGLPLTAVDTASSRAEACFGVNVGFYRTESRVKSFNRRHDEKIHLHESTVVSELRQWWYVTIPSSTI